MRDSTRSFILIMLSAFIVGGLVLLYAKISPTFQYNFISVLKSNKDYYPNVKIAVKIDVEAEDEELPADGESSTVIYAYPMDAFGDVVDEDELIFKAKLGEIIAVEKMDDGGYMAEYVAGESPGIDVITIIDKTTFRKIKARVKIKLEG